MVLETTSKTDQYNCTISNKCLQDVPRKNAAKTGTPRARRTAAGEGQADASGPTMQPEKAARLAQGATREGASRGARAGHGSRSGAGCLMGQRRAPRNRPQAGPGRWSGARCTNQGGGAGSARRAAHACALVRLPALPGWVGRCAPTARPPARRRLPGAWGRSAP